MNTKNKPPKLTTCQPPQLQGRKRPAGQTWIRARWALRLLSRHGEGSTQEKALGDTFEAAESLEAVAVYMAANGHPLEGFAALASAQALRGRFLTRDIAATAELSLRGFRFFDTGRTCSALELELEPAPVIRFAGGAQ